MAQETTKTEDAAPVRAKPFPLNDYQKAIIRTHGGGDYAHMAELTDETAFMDELNHCGDELFRFMVIELADTEGCDSIEVAHDRLLSASRQIDEALATLDQIPAPTPGA